MAKISNVHINQKAVMWEERTAGTNGDALTTSYTARKLNQIVDPAGIIKNPSAFTGVGGTNTQFQLAAGKYKITANAVTSTASPATDPMTKMRLRDVTNNVTLVKGETAGYGAGNGSATLGQGPTPLVGIFTLTGNATLELQQIWRTSAASTNGGTQYNSGENEIYVQVELEKIG